MKKVLTNCAMAIMLAAPLSLQLSPIAIAHEKSEQPATIQVSGTAKANVAPDMAIMRLGVLREAKTARAALNANNKAMAEVLASMKDAGIEERDLQTSNFYIQPRYVHHRPKKGEAQKPPRIVGYTVSNDLTVRVRDLTKVGEVLDKSVTLGVNNGGNIQFATDDPSAAIDKARENAMKNALKKAEILTSAANVELGDVITINENHSRPRPVQMARGKFMAEASMADQVPIAAGENSYSVTVNVQWQIKQ
ncbi:MAG: SIMPL domain-containing protein [Nitratireductor sp.]